MQNIKKQPAFHTRWRRRSPGCTGSMSAAHHSRGGTDQEEEHTLANVVAMKQLLEAGVHFGHQTRRWNPKMKQFIFTDRNGIHIIDLQQTVTRLNEAYRFVSQLVANGEMILFVGTKKQAQEAVEREAQRS